MTWSSIHLNALPKLRKMKSPLAQVYERVSTMWSMEVWHFFNPPLVTIDGIPYRSWHTWQCAIMAEPCCRWSIGVSPFFAHEDFHRRQYSTPAHNTEDPASNPKPSESIKRLKRKWVWFIVSWHPLHLTTGIQLAILLLNPDQQLAPLIRLQLPGRMFSLLLCFDLWFSSACLSRTPSSGGDAEDGMSLISLDHGHRCRTWALVNFFYKDF